MAHIIERNNDCCVTVVLTSPPAAAAAAGASLLAGLAFWSPQPAAGIPNLGSSSSTAGAWITLGGNVLLTVSLRSYSSSAAGEQNS
jgi:hypothetical protein